MIKKDRVTIRDVAKAAGVSISTVSKALNNNQGVSYRTQKEIVNVARELNYVPNLMGKQLKSGKSNMIGVYTNRISGPYFNSLIDEIACECKLRGYALNIIVSDEKQDILNSLLGNIVDGAIIIEDILDQDDIATINASGVPTIFINRIVSASKIGSVVFDSFEKGYLLGEYLLSLGHKNIGYVDGAFGIYDNYQRFRGFKAALSEAGITYHECYTIQGNFVEQDAYANTLYFLKSPPSVLPTAFLAANDRSAVGLINALKEQNYSIPGDFSVASFDDDEGLKYYNPKLTTIRNSIKEQGGKATKLLLDMIDGNDLGHVIEIKGELIIRDTVKEYPIEQLTK